MKSVAEEFGRCRDSGAHFGDDDAGGTVGEMGGGLGISPDGG